MRPRIHVVLTAEERKSLANWSGGVLTVVVLLAAGMVALALFQREAVTPLSVIAKSNADAKAATLGER